jgi:hypothetical protein
MLKGDIHSFPLRISQLQVLPKLSGRLHKLITRHLIVTLWQLLSYFFTDHPVRRRNILSSYPTAMAYSLLVTAFSQSRYVTFIKLPPIVKPVLDAFWLTILVKYAIK